MMENDANSRRVIECHGNDENLRTRRRKNKYKKKNGCRRACGEECVVGCNKPPCAGRSMMREASESLAMGWRTSCGGRHHRQPHRTRRNAATPRGRRARHGAPQCSSQTQSTADIPRVRAHSSRSVSRWPGAGVRKLHAAFFRMPARPLAGSAQPCAKRVLATSLLADARWQEGPAANRMPPA